ncbi:MAG: murein biosynthesis integral membrane protein MurJ [Actinomycetota bacterium]|nr:murein biosynthesis integral membrane protein MurJ [Actinomycetota bacterium]
MDTPPDPHLNRPDEAGAGRDAEVLARFEAAARAAESAVQAASERAGAVQRALSLTDPETAMWTAEHDLTGIELSEEGGVADTAGTMVPPAAGEPAEVAAEPVKEIPTESTDAAPAKGKPGKLARSTAFFSIATAASRVAGLVREIVAASYFGVTGPMSAFTVAFQVPNLIRALFADAALQPAFVPIFTEQVERGKVKEAFRLASTMLLLVTMVLGVITAVFILGASFIMPLFAPGFSAATESLMVVLSQIIFPILILLGVTGVVVGILNSYDRFGAFAISPFFWNITIIAVVVATVPLFPEDKQIYAYAIGVLAGTLVQLLIPTWDLRNTPFRFTLKVDFKDPNVRRVLLLMVPVTLSLGLINFNLLINSFFGSLVSDEAPAAIDKAFRIYQLPQGIFSVAIATVLFPTLARFATRKDWDSLRVTLGKGMRQIMFVLVPATAAILVLSEPMIRIVFERGEFGPAQTELVSTALFWFAFSLPTNGMFLLLSRTFFGLQKPWIPTWIAAGNLAVTALASLLLYKPFGVAGIVAATAIATAVSVLLQTVLLRPRVGGIELGRLIDSSVRIAIGSIALAIVSYEVWDLLDHLLGRGLTGQILSLGAGLGLGGIAYVACCRVLRVPELDQIVALVRRRS